jgi:integrase
LTRVDVERLKRAVKEGKTARRQRLGQRRTVLVRGGGGAANRVLALLSKMMNLAEKWGLRPDGSNPCRHVDKYGETKRERFLSADELARLGDVLAEAERTATELPGAIAAVRLLALTGCRVSEIVTLRWQDVDLAAACLRLPDSKTGAKTVHLNAPALAVLAAIERDPGSPWVIRGGKPGARLINLQKPWRRIRANAGLENVRLHDLRHSHASVAVGLGEGLPMIGKLLGHSTVATTARYAHLAADPVKAATERVGAAIAGMMARRPGEVVPLSKRRG